MNGTVIDVMGSNNVMRRLSGAMMGALPKHRTAIILASLIAAFIVAVLVFMVNVLPYASESAYLEARRWIRAAVHVEKLPKALPRQTEYLPCPPAVQYAQPGATVSQDQYFPLGVLGCNDRHEKFLTEWYSEQLRALHEPSLWALSRNGSRVTTYRFLWLRSFHQPIAIRLVINADWTGELILKVGGGAGGYRPRTLVKNVTGPAGKHGTTLLFAQVLQTEFWNLPSRGKPGGTDGAQWIIEGVDEGRYHIVERWSPSVGDPAHTLGMTLIADLAALQIAPDLVY